MPRFDTVIKNGMIVDGTRAPRYHGEIGIKDGRIAEIGQLYASDGATGNRRFRPDHRTWIH